MAVFPFPEKKEGKGDKTISYYTMEES